jgi:hypothetical protein
LPFYFSFRQLSGEIGGDDPVTIGWGGIGHHNHHDMFASTDRRKPTNKEPSIPEAYAMANLVGLGERFCNTRAMFRQEIWMPLGNMSFSLLRQLNLTL